MTPQQIEAISAISNCVIETVKEVGSLGAPGGSIYATFATFGFTLQQYEALMSSLVETGKLQKRGHCYFAPVESTADFKDRLSTIVGEPIDWSNRNAQSAVRYIGFPTVRTEADRGFYPPARTEAA